jgi:DNA-binding winged helix-turn-helix (wHTH) protein
MVHSPASPPGAADGPYHFGEYELDVGAGELRRNSRRLKLQPQPFKLLVLLARRAGRLVTREEIRQELWPDGTFVDFDQAVNFSVKQIRDVLQDAAERPLYVQTVPKRGYRFIAPVSAGSTESRPRVGGSDGTMSVRLQKALWTNIAEIRMAEARRRRYTLVGTGVITVLLVILAVFLLFSR